MIKQTKTYILHVIIQQLHMDSHYIYMITLQPGDHILGDIKDTDDV